MEPGAGSSSSSAAEALTFPSLARPVVAKYRREETVVASTANLPK
jgi:hypothetical protein